MLRFVNSRSTDVALAAFPYGGEESAAWCYARMWGEERIEVKGVIALAAPFYFTAVRFVLSFLGWVWYAVFA